MGQLVVVGIGPGSPDYVLPEVSAHVETAGVLVGGPRAHELFRSFSGRRLVVSSDLARLFHDIHQELSADTRVVVLLSGDTGVYSLLERLKQEFGQDMLVIPGLSSIQLAAARLKVTWQDSWITSTHHRLPDNIVEGIRQHRRTFVLAGPTYDAAFLIGLLNENGITDCTVSICCDLSYEQEEVHSYGLSSLSQEERSGLVKQVECFKNRSAVVVIEKHKTHGPTQSAFGLADSDFIVGAVPMTKQEIRAIALSKLNLTPSSVVYDIGCGTGSITIQAAVFASRGLVFAIDKNKSAIELVKRNMAKFGLTNIRIRQGAAPEALGPTRADAVFIGGSDGNLEEILEASLALLKPDGRIVVTAVTMETLTKAWKVLEARSGLRVEVLSAAIAKTSTMGRFHVWKAQNPVYIFTIERE